MKKRLSAIALILSGFAVNAQIASPPDGDNEKSAVIQWIGPVEVSIVYSSPDVHGRNGEDRKGHIWGELVHNGFAYQGYGVKEAPWRAGANENTIIKFSHDVKVGGKDLQAGAYGLFMAYDKNTPTWIFSKNAASWGSYAYNASEDALRITSAAQDAPYTEFLTYGFDNRLPSSATAYVQWENKKIPLTIEVPNVNQLYVDIIRNQLRGELGFDPRNLSAAAQFCADKKINLEEGLAWADGAMNPELGGTANFPALKAKAAVLTAMGKDTEAMTIMDQAIKLPTTSMQETHQYARSLLASGKKEKALEVFQLNQKMHPEEKFTTYVGLARAYAAVGDKKNAIKNWEIALKNVPETQKQNINAYTEEVKKLKS